MTQREFVRWLLFDTAAFCIILATLVGLILIGPAWTAGAIAFVGVPLVLVGFVGWATWTTRPSRRRETDHPGTDHAHELPASSPAATTGIHGPTRTLPPAGRTARMDVCTSWTDFAWAVHHTAFRSWRRTRPGR